MLWAALVSAIIGALLWGLWVLPIAASVREAEPVTTGESVQVAAGSDVVGIWAYGRSAILGTLVCAVDGEQAQAWKGPSLTWDDVLWWVPGRMGFVQELQVRLDPDTAHEVTCTDALGTYEAEYVVARDTFGSTNIGLGRSGSADFALGTILPVGAVMAPAFTLMFPLIALTNAVRRRRRRP